MINVKLKSPAQLVELHSWCKLKQCKTEISIKGTRDPFCIFHMKLKLFYLATIIKSAYNFDFFSAPTQSSF